jgi:hypothetical protein
MLRGTIDRLRPVHYCTAAVALLAIYVGSYLINSKSGGYWLQPERDGGHRWGSGLSMHTAVLWQPALGYHSRYKSDWLGTIYGPLIVLDRHWFHQTKYVTDESTFTWYKEEARAKDIHPQWRAEFAAQHPDK